MSSIITTLLKRKVQEQDSPIHKVDPRVKFLFFLWISIWSYIYLDYYITIFYLIGILVLSYIGKTLKRVVSALAIVILPWIAVAVPILGALFPWNETPIYKTQILLWEFTLYYEGVAWGVAFPLRIAVCLSSALFFLFTTEPVKLIALLFKLRLPFRFIYMIAGSLQLTNILLEEYQTILQAQKSRGLRTDVNILKRIFTYAAILIPLTLSTLNKVQIRAIALMSRGFSAPVEKTWPYELSFKKVDYLFLIGIILLTMVFVYIYLKYGFSPLSGLKFYLVVG
ncbi:MAG: energy-coupling factor transporter transmembrane protein EcfT [Nitrososphaeria archaeon]|nr:energy-coupling factor transporter transmembrane protein EcfT [Nitrososphaeria archaeon]